MKKTNPASIPDASGNRNSELRRRGRGSRDWRLQTIARLQGIDLESLRAGIRTLPELDAARIVELHNRIQAGEYAIDDQQLADKLLELERLIES